MRFFYWHFKRDADKILKHYKMCNWVYCIVLILDPRHKTKSFSKTEWGRQMESESIHHFKKMLKNKYYDKFCDTSEELEMPVKRRKLDTGLLDLKCIYQNRSEVVDWQAELNEYLDSPCASEDADILEWWRAHEKVYPILSKMAKDLLCIQATSVPVERLFSHASQIIVPRRRMLKDDIFKALCTINSWVKCTLVKEICCFSP